MEIWSERMPFAWIDTTNYLSAEDKRIGPRWNIFDELHCLHKSKTHYNSTTMNSCRCTLSKMSSRNTYLDFSLTHSLFFGDSTLRNFEGFMRMDLHNSLYVTVVNHQNFLTEYLQAYNLLYPKKPFSRLQEFTSSLVEYDQKMRKQLPSKFPFFERIHHQCLNLSLSRQAVVSYMQEAYEDLDSAHIPYYSSALDSCLHNPNRLLMFVLTGGLHYLTVRVMSRFLLLTLPHDTVFREILHQHK
jgi:hypothetical protein